MKRRSSVNGSRDPYMRDELWIDGTLVFWNTDGHNKEAYNDFMRTIKERNKNPKK